jgi:hypothetical protein
MHFSHVRPYPASNFTLPGRTVCVLSGRWDIPLVRPESVRGTSKCRAQGCPTVDSQWTSPQDIVGTENFENRRKEIRVGESGHPSN